MTNELKHVSRAIAVDNLTAIVSNLAEIRQNLAAIEQDTGLLQLHANRLQVLQHRSIFSSSFYKEIVLERETLYIYLCTQDGLLEIKRQLKLLLDRCAGQPVCASFRQQYDLDLLSVDLTFQEVNFNVAKN